MTTGKRVLHPRCVHATHLEVVVKNRAVARALDMAHRPTAWPSRSVRIGTVPIAAIIKDEFLNLRVPTFCGVAGLTRRRATRTRRSLSVYLLAIDRSQCASRTR